MNTEEKAKRDWGTGSVIQFKGSRFFSIRYYRNGKRITESTKSEKIKVAKNLLNKRIGEMATHTWVDPKDQKVTVDELYKALIVKYKNDDMASLEGAQQRWEWPYGTPDAKPGRLKEFFSGIQALSVTTDKLDEYVEHCKEVGLSNGTINRDLAALRKAFNLAYKRTPRKISSVPTFPMLEEAPARKGFLEDSTYTRLTQHAPELWLRTLLECLFTWGNRKSELLNLKVGQVDLAKRIVVLNAGETKNDDWRVLPMTQALSTLLTACVSGKGKDAFVFTDDTGGHRRKKGAPIKDFRGRWERLLSDAGVDGKQLVHDFRRTAVRNMERAGIPRSQAMKISGHKTEAVYRRYAIVNESDLHEATKKLEASRRVWAENGQSFTDQAPQENQQSEQKHLN